MAFYGCSINLDERLRDGEKYDKSRNNNDKKQYASIKYNLYKNELEEE